MLLPFTSTEKEACEPLIKEGFEELLLWYIYIIFFIIRVTLSQPLLPNILFLSREN